MEPVLLAGLSGAGPGALGSWGSSGSALALLSAALPTLSPLAPLRFTRLIRGLALREAAGPLCPAVEGGLPPGLAPAQRARCGGARWPWGTEAGPASHTQAGPCALPGCSPPPCPGHRTLALSLQRPSSLIPSRRCLSAHFLLSASLQALLMSLTCLPQRPRPAPSLTSQSHL